MFGFLKNDVLVMFFLIPAEEDKIFKSTKQVRVLRNSWRAYLQSLFSEREEETRRRGRRNGRGDYKDRNMYEAVAAREKV